MSTWKASSRSANQWILRFSWNLKVHYRVQETESWSRRIQSTEAHPFSFKIHSNIILQSTLKSSLQVYRLIFCTRIYSSSLPYVLHAPSAECSHLLTLVPRSRIFLPWRWRGYVLSKRRFTQDLRGVTSQKTAFFIVTAVKTSNLTKCSLLSLDKLLKWIIIYLIFKHISKVSVYKCHVISTLKTWRLRALCEFFIEV
jgi:hypothetical protein